MVLKYRTGNSCNFQSLETRDEYEEERSRFYHSIDKALSKPQDREKQTFALLLYYSGCRISEGLTTTYKKIDYSSQGVVFETLKRRKKMHRFVPLPHPFLVKLDAG